MIMRLKSLYNKRNCLGLIFKDKNNSYDYQNFNDLGFAFGDYSECKNNFVRFRKMKINKKEWVALICINGVCDYDYTLSECVKYICDCYNI